MPLRCFDPVANCDVHAFDLSPECWRQLRTANNQRRWLRMPCCSAQVTLRTSRRGTQFFAHKAIGACTTAPETEDHLWLKRMAVEIARAHGWAAETEASGTTPSGELWRADVLAHNGKHRVAVEIQWSAQTLEKTMRRQARYAASGVRCLWLMRRLEFPVDRALPAARICGDAKAGYTATLKTVTGQQVLPIEELLAGAFSKRLRFGIPIGTSGQVQIFVRTLRCWSCRARTQIISHVCVVVGPNTFRFSVSDFDDHLALFDFIRLRLPNDLQIGSVKHRFTSVRRLAYLSNGCFHCDARFEQSYGSGAKVCEFSIAIDTQWLEIMGERHGWGVYPPSSSGQFSRESRI
ncbi:competence protein CoiA family protein [Reyranella sp.]|uniref:competence protein CoiA n=1 Tax=Reyranella sp. TaxID=1929291 RepID=UPI0026317A21|nr:competence protein CoiA family protein [Reyranella sp.]HQS13614.1 competence protein CoiA family protein [Reyranella sp.]HQT10099.1 competence protein CoiA family protein [Reyranella sp.]